VQSSHPANSIPALKSLVGWMGDNMPVNSWGSYELVRDWIGVSNEERRAQLEARNLIYTAKEETWLAIKESA
jgi:hypothetical protein